MCVIFNPTAKKYGSSCSNEQLEFYRNEERKNAKRVLDKARSDAAGAITAKKNEDELNRLMREMVDSGQVVISISGKRVKVDESFNIPCPSCGASINMREWVKHLAGAWQNYKKTGRINYVRIINGLNPLSEYCGAPMFHLIRQCPACKETTTIIIQMLIV